MPTTGTGFCRCNKTFIMTNKLIGLVAGIVVIAGSTMLFAQGGAKPANAGEGTLMVKGKTYPLKNAAAYETTIDGEDGIAVVLSGPTISSEKVNEARNAEKAVTCLISGNLTSNWSLRGLGNSRVGAPAPATYPWADAEVMRPGK